MMMPEATDCVLDDVVHIDTDEKGGILAGSNSCNVLFAAVKWHHMADHRFRGQARTIMAQSIADYAETHKNVTYIYVWSAQGLH